MMHKHKLIGRGTHRPHNKLLIGLWEDMAIGSLPVIKLFDKTIHDFALGGKKQTRSSY